MEDEKLRSQKQTPTTTQPSAIKVFKGISSFSSDRDEKNEREEST